MENSVIRTMIVLFAVAASSLTTSCGNDLVSPVLVNPGIEALEFSPFYSRPGIVAITAQFPDTSARLRPSERIAVRVTVEGGDEETMMLEHSVCFIPDPFTCSTVSVGMRSGRTVDDISGMVASFPARWHVTFGFQTNGSLRVFDSRRVPDVITALRRHPAVASVEREAVGVPAISPPPPIGHLLLAALPLDYDSPTPNDGTVQGQKGALLTLRYTQPDGSVLMQTWAVP